MLSQQMTQSHPRELQDSWGTYLPAFLLMQPMSYSSLLCIPVPFKTHMGPTWACLRITHVYCAHQAHLKPIWVPHGHAHVLPMFVVPTKPIYNPYGSHMGMPTYYPCLLCPPSPPKTYMGPTWACPCLTHVCCAHQTHL